MKLFYSPTSPFVRKVLVVAHEKKLINSIELLTVTTSPVEPNPRLIKYNPLAKIPALVLDSGKVIFDSSVICEYVDSLSTSYKLIPDAGTKRWEILTLQAEADGMMDAGIMVRYENLMRPKEVFYTPWVDGQTTKVMHVLEHWNTEASSWNDDLNLGAISVICALDWLIFRKPFEFDWSAFDKLTEWHRRMSVRPSLLETYPKI